jgi:hypothetical protein
MESPTPPVEPAIPPVPPAEPGPKTNVLAITSLATGILGILSACLGTPLVSMVLPVFAFFCLGGGGLLGLVSVITGIIAQNQISTRNEGGKGLAIGGIISGALTIAALCLLIVITFVLLIMMGPVIGNVFSRINSTLQSP